MNILMLVQGTAKIESNFFETFQSSLTKLYFDSYIFSMCDFMFCPFLQLSFIARQSLKSCKMVTWSAKFPFNGLLRKVLTSSYVIETSKSSMFPVLGHLECLGLELLAAGILETNRAVSRISGIDSQAV